MEFLHRRCGRWEIATNPLSRRQLAGNCSGSRRYEYSNDKDGKMNIVSQRSSSGPCNGTPRLSQNNGNDILKTGSRFDEDERRYAVDDQHLVGTFVIMLGRWTNRSTLRPEALQIGHACVSHEKARWDGSWRRLELMFRPRTLAARTSDLAKGSVCRLWAEIGQLGSSVVLLARCICGSAGSTHAARRRLLVPCERARRDRQANSERSRAG